ncbi:hypothetical protein [Chryseobacterium sediminis]|uniref:hypothetical protein n=1 Tax=Chryseobacterium sediminis TaxID=1679494 RepID=UPI00285C8C46|nr:hypothetical protein [Chryseobacterium sediminis]MDR6465282.1 hypothetical protein [Chryseobacterium sediminis]
MKKILFLVNMLFICNYCLGQSNINFYYQDKTQATETDSIGYKFYKENIPKGLQKKKNEVLLFLNNSAFIDDVITINNKNYNFNQYSCGYREIKVSKKKQIVIISKKKGKMKFNLRKGIDNIIISGDFDNKWSVTFSEYFPVLECI